MKLGVCGRLFVLSSCYNTEREREREDLMEGFYIMKYWHEGKCEFIWQFIRLIYLIHEINQMFCLCSFVSRPSHAQSIYVGCHNKRLLDCVPVNFVLHLHLHLHLHLFLLSSGTYVCTYSCASICISSHISSCSSSFCITIDSSTHSSGGSHSTVVALWTAGQH